jgi:hypothetical protein
MLCKPFYVGSVAYHIPNNVDINVTYKAGAVVGETGCIPIQPVDPQITQTRAWEKKFKLNTAGK